MILVLVDCKMYMLSQFLKDKNYDWSSYYDKIDLDRIKEFV